MRNIHDHYRDLFFKHGDAAQAVQYSDADSQSRRFEVLRGISQDLGAVVDLGCGLGHFCDYLRATGFRDSYLGLDFVGEFIDNCTKKHASDRSSLFERVDLLDAIFPDTYDTYFISGVFNNLMPDNAGFMEQILEKAFRAARKQVAFNALSTYVDFEADNLYYTDPCRVFDFCKRNLTRKVVLRHEYLLHEKKPPFEYTVYLYK